MDESPIQSARNDFYCYSGCGCTHEEWTYRGITFAIHRDDGLPISVLALVGEHDEIDIPMNVDTFQAARHQACIWIDGLMASTNLNAEAS